MHLPPPTASRCRPAPGSLLIEVSVAMGLAALVALLVMRSSLLAVSGNQWTVMQTLTDAYLTRETALAHRVPLADLTGPESSWPDMATDSPPTFTQTVTLGKLAGGQSVQASLTRFRMNASEEQGAETNLAVWRLHSVLSYQISDRQYVKSRSTLRMQ